MYIEKINDKGIYACLNKKFNESDSDKFYDLLFCISPSYIDKNKNENEKFQLELVQNPYKDNKDKLDELVQKTSSMLKNSYSYDRIFYGIFVLLIVLGSIVINSVVEVTNISNRYILTYQCGIVLVYILIHIYLIMYVCL